MVYIDFLQPLYTCLTSTPDITHTYVYFQNVTPVGKHILTVKQRIQVVHLGTNKQLQSDTHILHRDPTILVIQQTNYSASIKLSCGAGRDVRPMSFSHESLTQGQTFQHFIKKKQKIFLLLQKADFVLKNKIVLTNKCDFINIQSSKNLPQWI